VQDFDPVWFAYPVVIFVLSFGLIVYWHSRRSFTRDVMIYSLVAYGGAIALKYAIQLPTAAALASDFGSKSVVNGLYFGLQTVLFEVGGAFLVAWFAVKRGAFSQHDAEGFGLGLAFWENGVLLGLFQVLDLIGAYAILATNTAAAQSAYSTLLNAQPQLFYAPGQALPYLALGILERCSSLVVHVAWGYLCVVGALTRNRGYLLMALPMGMIDFFVVFASSLGLAVFEGLIFAFSLACFAVAMVATRGWRRELSAAPSPDANAI